MQRRSFIVTAGVGALAAAYGNLSARVCAPRKHRVVGLELITVMSLLNEDFRGTLSNVAVIRYEEVETLSSTGRAPAEVRSILEACHLTSPSQHLVPQDLYGVYQQWDRGVITMAQALASFVKGYALERIELIIEEGIARAKVLGQRYLAWLPVAALMAVPQALVADAPVA